MGTSDSWCGGLVSPALLAFPGVCVTTGRASTPPLAFASGVWGYGVGAGPGSLLYSTIRFQQHHPVPRHSEEDGEGSHGCVAAHSCSAQALAAPGSRDGNRRSAQGCFSLKAVRRRPLSGPSASRAGVEVPNCWRRSPSPRMRPPCFVRSASRPKGRPRHTMTLWADPRTVQDLLACMVGER